MADLRLAEFYAATTVPQTFLAVTMDLEDPDPLNNPFTDIHPRNKLEVGVRLANAGRMALYGIQGEENSFVGGCKVDGNTTVVQLQGVGENVAVRRVEGSGGVEVMDCNGVWSSAAIVGVGKDDFVVDVSGIVGRPAGIRYAWRNNPCCTGAEFEESKCTRGGGLCGLYVGSADGGGQDVPVVSFYREISGGECQ